MQVCAICVFKRQFGSFTWPVCFCAKLNGFVSNAQFHAPNHEAGLHFTIMHAGNDECAGSRQAIRCGCRFCINYGDGIHVIITNNGAGDDGDNGVECSWPRSAFED